MSTSSIQVLSKNVKFTELLKADNRFSAGNVIYSANCDFVKLNLRNMCILYTKATKVRSYVLFTEILPVKQILCLFKVSNL